MQWELGDNILLDNGKSIWDTEPTQALRRQSTYRRPRFNGCSLPRSEDQESRTPRVWIDPLCYSFNHFSCPMPVALKNAKITDDSDPNLTFLIMVIKPFTSRRALNQILQQHGWTTTDYYAKWSETGKVKYYHLHVESKKKIQMIYIQNWNTPTDIANNLMVTKGIEEWGDKLGV